MIAIINKDQLIFENKSWMKLPNKDQLIFENKPWTKLPEKTEFDVKSPIIVIKIFNHVKAKDMLIRLFLHLNL